MSNRLYTHTHIHTHGHTNQWWHRCQQWHHTEQGQGAPPHNPAETQRSDSCPSHHFLKICGGEVKQHGTCCNRSPALKVNGSCTMLNDTARVRNCHASNLLSVSHSDRQTSTTTQMTPYTYLCTLQMWVEYLKDVLK